MIGIKTRSGAFVVAQFIARSWNRARPEWLLDKVFH
jgi:hypothetical protein